MLRAMDRWLPAYLRRPRPPTCAGPIHVMLAVCDHFEPLHAARDADHSLERVLRWREEYPRVTAPFRDADGVGPKHTFFYPIEQYDERLLTPIGELAAAGHGEIEIHLHHGGDTAASLRAALASGIRDLRRHGAIARAPDGKDAFCFIHGNWALANCHPAGKHCGVADEIQVLLDAGCIADMTFPSAPSPTQPRQINQLAFVRDCGSPTALDQGVPAAAGTAPAADQLLLVHGPLGLDWRRRKAGVIPRLENADLTGANPPTLTRFRRWLELAPWVQGRPEWRFVKLHTHGGIERNMPAHLGDAAVDFHRSIGEFALANGIKLHYVSAREMVNIISAAIDGQPGEPGDYRDYRYTLGESR